MARYLLDTNIITRLLSTAEKSTDVTVSRKLMDALGNNDDVKLSVVSKYESLRGLCHRQAERQIRRLNEFVDLLGIVELVSPDWDCAAEEWGRLRRHPARPTAQWEDLDGDILIAAQARRTERIVVTDDERHFGRLDVQIANWIP